MQFNNDQRYDAVIIGSGPGGATVAKELSKKGKKVLILERGPGKSIRGNFIQYIAEQLIPGRSLLVTPDLLPVVRGITTGGSSLFYYGTAFPVPHEMLKRYGIDVRREEREARKELPIGPLKDAMITPMTSRIMESARALGYRWNKLEKFMFQGRWRPGFRFGYYGDVHGVKWSARMAVDEAVSLGATLLNGARAERVILDGNRAAGVEFRMKCRRHRVFADRVVVAAGGIGSPVILRKTGITAAGYDYFFDPLVTVCGTVNDVRARKDEIPMSAGCISREDGIVMTDMAVPFMVDQVFTISALRFWRLFRTGRTLRIMIKIRDDLSGRISDCGGVRKRLSPADKEKLRKGAEIARNILHHAGAKGIYQTWRIAAHPGGTARIGHVLDSNLKVEGYENLYVCDCSVFPEPWGLPPVLSIVCLAKRLAKHLLAGKKKAGRGR
jgi:choline dehydrogenase-like flavoprotein